MLQNSKIQFIENPHAVLEENSSILHPNQDHKNYSTSKVLKDGFHNMGVMEGIALFLSLPIQSNLLVEKDECSCCLPVLAVDCKPMGQNCL